MEPVTLGLIAMAVGAAIKITASALDDSGERQAALMHKQANMKLSALEETTRRAQGQQTQILSSTKARMAGSGFSSDSSSFSNYLTGMATEFQNQNDFAKRQGMAAVDLILGGADIYADQTKKWLGTAADVAGSAANIGSMYKPGP